MRRRYVHSDKIPDRWCSGLIVAEWPRRPLEGGRRRRREDRSSCGGEGPGIARGATPMPVAKRRASHQCPSCLLAWIAGVGRSGGRRRETGSMLAKIRHPVLFAPACPSISPASNAPRPVALLRFNHHATPRTVGQRVAKRLAHPRRASHAGLTLPGGAYRTRIGGSATQLLAESYIRDAPLDWIRSRAALAVLPLAFLSTTYSLCCPPPLFQS